jgi:streptogramin lyase
MTATYLINRRPSRILGMKSPAELLLGRCDFKVPPKAFGCVCFVKDHQPTVGKLDPQVMQCIFVPLLKKGTSVGIVLVEDCL